MALVYPNRYEVGMASIGFQTVFRLLNAHPDVVCERAFAVTDCADKTVRTIESGERINRFDFVGFSLSFELDQLNLIRCLMDSGIPPLRQDRTRHDPVIILGGIIAGLNPSPLLPFIDGLLAGEGEDVFFELGTVLSEAKSKQAGREGVLNRMSELDGIYIPGINREVTRQLIPKLDSHPAFTPIITPLSHFRNMFVAEVGRGCPRGCSFCAAHKIYKPFRYRSVDCILDTVDTQNPGADKIGLEGAGISDYPHLANLCEKLIQRNLKVSFSSVRADRVDERLMEMIDRGGVRSFTIAPETGSESLRKKIGKKITDETILSVAGLLSRSSIQMLKLYYLIGLPGEAEEDITAIAHLTRKICSEFIQSDRGKSVRISINAFIPKPFTALEQAPMDTEKELIRKRKVIRNNLKKAPDVTIVRKSVKEEILQGLLSLGDESVGLALLDSIRQNTPWRKVMRHHAVNVDGLFSARGEERDLSPWHFIHLS